MINTRLMVHIFVSAIYGWIYFDIGISASYIHDNLMLLFFSLLFIMFTASSSMIIHCKLLLFLIICFDKLKKMFMYCLNKFYILLIFKYLCFSSNGNTNTF